MKGQQANLAATSPSWVTNTIKDLRGAANKIILTHQLKRKALTIQYQLASTTSQSLTTKFQSTPPT